MTRPLTLHALGVLRSVNRHPRPAQDVNPGVVRKLTDEKLVDLVFMTSPYAKDQRKGTKVQYLVITDAGKEAIK